MFGAITAYLHEWLDYGLALCKMVKNRDVGWVTIDRKVATPIPSLINFRCPNLVCRLANINASNSHCSKRSNCFSYLTPFLNGV